MFLSVGEKEGAVNVLIYHCFLFATICLIVLSSSEWLKQLWNIRLFKSMIWIVSLMRKMFLLRKPYSRFDKIMKIRKLETV